MPERVRPGDLITADFFNDILDRLEEAGSGAGAPDLGNLIGRLESIERRLSSIEGLLNQFVKTDALNNRFNNYFNRAEIAAQLGEHLRRNEFETRIADFAHRSEIEARIGQFVTRTEVNTRFAQFDPRINNTGTVIGSQFELRDVTGVTAGQAEALTKAGFNEVQKLAEAKPEQVAKVMKVDISVANEVIRNAERMTGR
jgi:hypothetical protein